ncbi:MAG: hypothetical protein WBP34_13860 [Thermoanaerobaculia bacterium]
MIVGANLDAGCARALKVSESVNFLVLEDLAEPVGQLGQLHSTLDAVGLMNNAGSRTGSNRSRANGRLDLLDFELLKRRMYLTELTYWLGKIFENQEVD